MGANIQVDGKVAVIEGVHQLTGVTVKRLTSERARQWLLRECSQPVKTTVENVQYIDRGYENIVEKLTELGADIRRVTVDDEKDIEVHAG